MSEQWYRIFRNNFCIPHAKKRPATKQAKSWVGEPRPYVVEVSAIHWQNVDDVPVQLRLHLYDSNFKKFFGRSCSLPWMESFNVNEAIYFHLPQDEHIMLIFELTTKNACIGWTFVQLTDLRTASTQNKVQMFKGNPAVVRKILNKPGDISRIPKSGATIQFSYKLHNELAKVVHLLPENTLIHRFEIVPGLVAETDDVDNLANPQADREIRCSLSQVVCKLGPIGRRIDMEVCDLLNKERVLKENVAPNGEHLVILEKRLKIGIHNGWTYIKEPCLYYLMPRDKLGSRYSGSLVKLDTSATALMLKNVANFETLPRMSGMEDLMLTNPVEFTSMTHPAIALVFYLEYILGLQSAKPNPPAQVVTVAWAAWSPFESTTAHDQDVQRRMNLVLKGGPSSNPDHVLCFHDLYSLSPSIESNNNGLQIQLEFVFKSNVPKTAAPADSERSFVIPEQRNVQPKQPTIESGDETIVDVHSHRERIPVKTDQGSVQPADNSSLRFVPSQPKMKEMIENRPRVIYDEKPALKPIPMSRQIAILLADRKFDKILDRNGDEPHLIDFSRDNKFDLDSDFNDTLLCNEIIFYFQAIEMFEGVQVPNEIFFTLHFYKFPQVCTERLLTSALSGESDTGIFLLKHLDKLGRIVKDSNGFKVKFILDVNNMPPDTYHDAIRYLYTHVLCIEIWNSQSMMLFGSVSLPMRELCRRGKEAVYGYCNLPILSDQCEKANIDATTSASLQANADVLGFLYIQAANVGYPSSGGLDTLLLDFDEEKMSSNKGGLVRVLKSKRSKFGEENLCYKIIANRSHSLIARCDDLRPMLVTAKRLTGLDLDSLTEDKRQRLRRLEYFRPNIENMEYNHAEKASLQDYDRDLETIQQYRNSLKDQQIMAHIRRSLSIFYTIYPTMGNSDFFEFQLTNPYNSPCRMKIVITERNLIIIKNVNEWKLYKSIYSLKTPMDVSIFVDKTQKSGKDEEIILKPSECSYIPFKYESPLIDLQKFKAQVALDSRIKSLQEINRVIDVKFIINMNDEDHLLQNLTLNIEPQMPIFDRFYRFFHAECTSIYKILRFDIESLAIMHKEFIKQVPNSCLNVKVTDPTVVVDFTKPPGSSLCELHMKTSLFTSPAVKSFQILFYADQYSSRTISVWHICLHAVQIVEMSLVQGQSAKLTLHGRKDMVAHSRMIKCFHSADPGDVSFLQEQPVLLQAGQNAYVDIFLRSMQQGKKTIQFSMVDVELNQVLQMWHVQLDVSRPTVSKAFRVDVPISSRSSEDKGYISQKIPYANKYDMPRLYNVSVNWPKLVNIGDPILNLEPRATGSINLLFYCASWSKSFATEVLVFVSNQDGTLEDTFSLQTTSQ